MSDYRTGLIAEERPGDNLPVLSVAELSQEVKRTVEGRFERVRVRGEISGFKRAASGHLYMTLKDADAVIDAVCWRGSAGRLAIAPEDGLEVVASGRVTTYPARSKYQLVIDSLELAGEGALLKLLEERRRKLAAEGLFDPERKRPLPFLPEVIGVVTSPTGAVIRDIRHRLAERFPRHVLLWPVLVQGETAAGQVAAAIRGFNAIEVGGDGAGAVPRPDLLIVARGGGSLEDLWAFNEEEVVRAAAESEIPLISAVGHETDTTLIDYASDLRAPTPTAAAEMAVPVRAELLATTMDLGARTLAAAGRLLTERRTQVEGLGRGLPDPQRMLEEKTQRLDDRVERLIRAAGVFIETRRAGAAELAARIPRPKQHLAVKEAEAGQLFGRLANLQPRVGDSSRRDLAQLDAGRRLTAAWAQRVKDAGGRLEALSRLLESTSYQKVLARGFAVVRGPDGVVTEAAGVSPGLALEIEFADGKAAAVGGGGGGGSGSARKTRGRKREDGGGEQGQLL